MNTVEQHPENPDSPPSGPAVEPASMVSSAGGRPRRVFARPMIVAFACGFLTSYFYLAAPPHASLRETRLDEPAAAGPDDPSDSADAPERQLPISAELPADTPALLAEADAVTGDLVRRYPNDPNAQEMKARLQLYQGDTAGAVESWQRCLELDANYRPAYEGLGSVAAQQAHYEDATTHYQRAVQIAPDSAPARIGLAKSLIEQGKLEEGIAVLEQNVAASPQGVEQSVLLGMAYSRKQNHAKAKEHYQAAVARDPRHANARLGLADASAGLGLADEAQQHREEFQRLQSLEREVRQEDRKQYEDLAALGKVIAALYTDAGRICLAHGSPADAEQLWKRAAALDPRDTNCRQALAWYYLQRQRPRDTIAMLGELARLEPDNPSYPLEAARLHLSINQIDAAEKTLVELCARWPRDASVHAALAEVYVYRRQPEKALSHARTAVELDPSADSHLKLAGALELNGELENALRELRRAIDLDPANVHYRQVYELLQQKAAGRQGP